MAALPGADRLRIWRGLMRFWSAEFEEVANLSKADLRAAVDATDDWIDANAASYNSALPVAARTNLSAAQKTVLFCAIALMRVGIGFLKRVFTEVD